MSCGPRAAPPHMPVSLPAITHPRTKSSAVLIVLGPALPSALLLLGAFVHDVARLPFERLTVQQVLLHIVCKLVVVLRVGWGRIISRLRGNTSSVRAGRSARVRAR